MNKIQVIPLFAIIILLSACGPGGITWKTGSLEVHLNQNGYVDKLVDPQSGNDYAVKQQASPLIQVRVNNEYYQPESITSPDNSENYIIQFADIDCEALLSVEENKDYIRLEITKLNSSQPVELLVWGPYQNSISETIGEIVGVVRDQRYAIGLQALNIRTLGGYPSLDNDRDKAYNIFESNSIVDVADSIKVFYRGQTAKRNEAGSIIQAYVRDRSKTRVIPNWNHDRYVAPSFHDEGIPGTAIALFGCHPDQALKTIENIELGENLPHPVIDGEWTKTLRSATASYLIMNFGESNLDQAMELTQQAGLKYLYHGGPFVNWGHFDLNPQEFPDNWVSMRKCVERAKEEGLRLGLHTLSNFITTNDPYVTPVPDPRLAQVGSSLISQAIDQKTKNIIIDSPDFFNQMKNNTLHAVLIDQEIIRYRAVSEQAPWTLLDCERGAYGTKASAHEARTPIAKLMDHGYKTFLTNAELSKEVALRIADLYNQTGLRQISFDGLEGNWSTGMGQYGRQLFVKYWYDALKPDLQGKVITDASNPGHFFWHMYTRMNWGEPWYAGFRESQTQYRLLNQDFYQRNLMPRMLGWFRMTSQISLEDIEWLLARAAGFDAGFALVTSPEIVDNHGLGNQIMQTIKNWEQARMAGAFPEELKPDLQNINNEFHLSPNGPKSWNLYSAIVVRGDYPYQEKQPGEPNQKEFNFKNENPDQPVSFIISSPIETGMNNIQLEIDHYRKVLIPINLPPNHHLKYTGGSYVTLFDDTWHTISRERVIQENLMLTQGDHQILVEGVFTSTKGDIKFEFRTQSPEQVLTIN